MRFLCASNLHLGRRISGVPDHLNLDPARISTSAIWNQLVETAVSEEVDAVLIAGNVIDRENRQFEPLGPLERGLATLQRHDIQVIAVAGDQDFDTLPAVARRMGDAFQIFAPTFGHEGITVGERVIRGRSADSAIDHESPLAGLPATSGESFILLLPSTLTDGHSTNAFQPLSADDVSGLGAALCILGHSREPDLVELDGQVVLEPGAICPLDPSETGPHGVWTVDTDHVESSQLLAISPVQFESVDIDVSGAESADAVEHLIVGALHDTLTRCVENDPRGQLTCVPCVVTLTGTTDHHHELPDRMREIASTLDVQHNGVVGAISTVQIDTRPDIDLEPLAGRPDPVGELARLLMSLDDDSDNERSAAHDALIQRTVTRLQGVHRARVFAPVANDPEPDVDMARDILRRESWNVLDALIRQRGVEV